MKRLCLKHNHSGFFLLFIFSEFLQLATVGDRFLCWLDFWSRPAWLPLTCPALHRNPVAEEAIPSVGKHSAALTTTLYFLFSSHLTSFPALSKLPDMWGECPAASTHSALTAVFLECIYSINFPISEAYLSVEVCQQEIHSTTPKPMGLTGFISMGCMPGLEELDEKKGGSMGWEWSGEELVRKRGELRE